MLGGRYDTALGRVIDSKANRHHGFFHFDGKRIGNVGNVGIEREDYVQQMSRVRDAEVSPDAKYVSASGSCVHIARDHAALFEQFVEGLRIVQQQAVGRHASVVVGQRSERIAVRH
jgi:hypothetical protein